MRRRLLLFAALALVYSCVSFHRVTMAVIGDLLADEFRLGPAELGFLGGILLYCYAFMQLPSGVFADHVGPKRTILLSLALSAAGSVAFAVSPNYHTAILARVLIGIGISFIYLSLIKILSRWFENHEFGTVLGILMALGMLGNMLATSPLAYSVKVMNWRWSYVLVAVLTVGLMWLVFSRVQNAPDSEGNSADGGTPPAERIETFGDKLSGVMRAVWALMRNRSYVMLCIFMAAGASAQGFQSLWAGPFLSRSYQMSLVEVGNALLWYSVGGICGAPLWGFLSDRVFRSRKRVLMLSTLAAIGVWFFPAFVPSIIPRGAVPGLLFAMALAGGAGVLTHAMVRESFSFEIMGIAVGIVNFVTFLGGAFFTQAMGNIVELFPRTNGDYPPLAYQATLMLVFVMWLIRFVSLLFAEEKNRIESPMNAD
jgi:sugar phosphate permease